MIKPKTYLATRLLWAVVTVMVLAAPWIIMIGVIGYLLSILVGP